MKIVILAAGRGSRMGSHTDDKPKCLTRVRGRSLLEAALEACSTIVDENEIFIVGGYKHEMLRSFHSQILVNQDWASTNIMGSLMLADSHLKSSPVTVVYSDILFDPGDLEAVVAHPVPAVLSVTTWREAWGARFRDPKSDLETFETTSDGKFLTGIGNKVTELDFVQGQFGGIFSLSPENWSTLNQSVRNLRNSDATSALSALLDLGTEISVVPTKGDWAEFDTASDIRSQT